MSLSTEDLRFAVLDARAKLEKVCGQIAEGDKQAQAFLQIYVTLAVAALSSAAVILLSSTSAFPISVGFGLLGFGLMMIHGATFAVVTLWPSDINLPGQSPSFWRWASHEGVGMDVALRTYLERIDADLADNKRLLNRMGSALIVAKCSGPAAPVIGLVCGLAIHRFPT
jgi:hypothetical protein